MAPVLSRSILARSGAVSWAFEGNCGIVPSPSEIWGCREPSSPRVIRNHPAVDDMEPRVFPLSALDVDLSSIDMVVNALLHCDHLGGNRLFLGFRSTSNGRSSRTPEAPEEYTIPEWVDPPGVTYVPVDGELELLPGVRLLPAPGHTRGSQIVVIEADGGPIVIAGDTAVFFGELDEPTSEGQRLIRSLKPRAVWLSLTPSLGDRARPAFSDRTARGSRRARHPAAVRRAARRRGRGPTPATRPPAPAPAPRCARCTRRAPSRARLPRPAS